MASPTRLSIMADDDESEDEYDGSSGEEWKEEGKESSESESSFSESELEDCDNSTEQRKQNISEQKEVQSSQRQSEEDGPLPVIVRRKRKKTSAPRRRKQQKKSRKRFKCLMPGCIDEVVNLRRHFENVHEDIPKFEVDKMISESKERPKRSYPVKKCTYQGCEWKGTRPDKHMRTKHGLGNSDALQQAAACPKLDSSKPENKQLSRAESLSNEFLIWFQSLEGGYFVPSDLPENKRKQRESQNNKIKFMVEQILEECFGEDAFPIGALVQLKLIGRDRCTQNSVTKSVILTIKEGRQGKEPLTWGTVKNYLSAFSHFLDFLEACYCSHNLDVKGMRNVLKGIVRSVNKFVAEEGQRRKLKCREKVIPAELMSKYFEHKIAHTLLKDMKKRGKIQNGKFHAETRERESVRNHILLQTALSSGKRCGALCDMKCSQVFCAQTVGEDERVVLVEDGKTFRTSGAAGIHFSSEDYKNLIFYIEHLRPQALLHDQVFCHIDGRHSTPSDLNNFIQTAFNEFGMMFHLDVQHITCTLIRKSLVSIVREEGICREDQIIMANHMDHLVDTADRIYDTSTGVKRTAMFSRIVDRFIRTEHVEDSEEDEEDEQSDDPEIEQAASLMCAGECEEEQPQPSCSTSTSTYRFGQPEIFSPEDRERVLRCSKPLIEKRLSDGKPLKREDAVAQIKEGGMQFEDLLTRFTQKQLYNRIRLELRKEQDKKKKEKKKV